MHKEVKELAQWIEASKPGIRKRDVKVINEIPSLILAYKTICGLQGAIYDHAPLTSTCSNIGKNVCLEYEASGMDVGDRNVRRVNVGWHLLNVMFDNNKLKLREGREGRDKYTISVVDDEWIDNMMYSINAAPLNVKLHSKPIFDEPLQYTEYNHPILGEMVRKCHPDVVSYFNTDNCETVFNVINKHMRTGFVVNQDVLSTVLLCKGDNIYSRRDKNLEQDARIGIQREQTAVLDTAKSIGDRTFYQGMFYDFRGRIYSSLIYFSPQGSKLSKSLFYLADKAPIGREGWYWMLVDAANKWGEDKLSLDDGFEFAEENLDTWMDWAANPVENKGWQEADDYWGFLASILEIRKAINYVDGKYKFPSGLSIAWDATCSGLQVLSALTRDEKAGKLCNLTGEHRGDYYKHIADVVWEDCKYTEEEETIFKGISFDLKRLQRSIDKASGKKNRKEAIEELTLFLEENRDDIKIATKVFWGRPEMKALSRKICKRPCMTYFYSCQPKTMAKQIYADFKSEPEFYGIQVTYCYWLANRVYKACREEMPIATKMMDTLIQLGIKDYKDEDDFSITAPYSGFKLMQYYRNPLKKRVKVFYKGKRVRLEVIIGRGDSITYKKVRSATSPNFVHMMDSQIVASVIMNATYPVNIIHDSFSTNPANAGRLYEDCRTCFVELFKENLLDKIMDEKGFDVEIELGELDLDDVYDQMYTFK